LTFSEGGKTLNFKNCGASGVDALPGILSILILMPDAITAFSRRFMVVSTLSAAIV